MKPEALVPDPHTSRWMQAPGPQQPCSLPYQDPAHPSAGWNQPQDPLVLGLSTCRPSSALKHIRPLSQLSWDTILPTRRSIPVLGYARPRSESCQNRICPPTGQQQLQVPQGPGNSPRNLALPTIEPTLSLGHRDPGPIHQQAETSSRTPWNPLQVTNGSSPTHQWANTSFGRPQTLQSSMSRIDPDHQQAETRSGTPAPQSPTSELGSIPITIT